MPFAKLQSMTAYFEENPHKLSPTPYPGLIPQFGIYGLATVGCSVYA
jgi:hypothetical protein